MMLSNNNFDWLIIGGGIHGVHIASRILERSGRTQAKVGIVDPWPNLMHRWHQCTGAIDMKYLRSPAVHNLASDPFDLQKQAGKRTRYKSSYFKQPYSRPSTAFFKRHSESIIDHMNLESLHIRAKAEKICLSNNLARIGEGSLQHSHHDHEPC